MTIFSCLITNLHKIVAFEATVSSSDCSRNIASHRSPNRISFFDEDDDRIRLLSSYDYFNFKKIRINHLLTTIIDESNCIKNYFSIQVTNSIGDDINVIDASQLTNDDCKRYLNFIYSGLVIHMMGCLQALFNQFIAKYSKDSIVFDDKLLFVPLGCIREYRQTMSNPILEKEYDLLLGFEKCVVGAYENMNYSKSKYLMSDSLKQYFLLALDLLCLLVRALDQHKYRLSLSELSDFEDELITFFDNVNKR